MRRKRGSPTRVTWGCAICGAALPPTPTHRRYCSLRCRNQQARTGPHAAQRLARICERSRERYRAEQAFRDRQRAYWAARPERRKDLAMRHYYRRHGIRDTDLEIALTVTRMRRKMQLLRLGA